MQFIILIFKVLLTAVIIKANPINSNRNEREVSTSFEDDSWLKDLESQILSNPNDVKTFLSGTDSETEISEGIVDNNNEEEFGKDKDSESTDEPTVVTAKPYLTGDILSTEEQLEFETASDQSVSDDGLLINPQNLPAETNKKISSTRISTLPSIPASSTVETIYNNEDKDTRRLLDGILTNKQNRTVLLNINLGNSRSKDEILKDGSEIKSFVELVTNQTQFIILGCILSLIVLIALPLSVYQILQKLSERTNITLIAHYEHDILNENEFQKPELLRVSE